MDLRRNIYLKLPRKIIKHILGLAYYPIVYFYGKPKVANIYETVEYIISNKASISRFGDGELSILLFKASYPFQKYDPRLADIYLEILKNETENLLVGLPIGYESLDNLDFSHSLMWRAHFAMTWPKLKKRINPEKKYYNASITRPYFGRVNQEGVAEFFELIKKIWDNRDVLLIEGEKSRLGIGNDLFDNVKSLKRILAPNENAFEKFDQYINFIKSFDRNFLILIALGPTATALAYELHKLGFQAIDIGNIDLEYEWFRMGTKKKIKIEGKYVSEVKGGREVADIKDEKYFQQIIYKFI
ncbi:MAG: GT-D fold domain-containing glycosyltransferase [Thermaurantimonas sp.]|uniref:GT-D fold domain-containing glycosyltransferase n=1 Tax=Thermaurantimonas sp. TaxID=2681568 RepID=UPI003919917D